MERPRFTEKGILRLRRAALRRLHFKRHEAPILQDADDVRYAVDGKRRSLLSEPLPIEVAAGYVLPEEPRATCGQVVKNQMLYARLG